MIWWLGYVILVAVLLVRVQSPDAVRRAPVHAGPGEPLRLIMAHHAIFYAILLGAPLEAVTLGGASGGRAIGLLCFAAGVAAYRWAGRALGAALSPLVTPSAGATLVTAGPYRYLRHPMYLGQVLIAVGAPLTLGARWIVWLAVPAIAILVVRARLEDVALAHRFPAHAAWATRAKRLVPFVF